MKFNKIAKITMGQSPKSTAYNTSHHGLPFLQGKTTFGRLYPSFDVWTNEWNKEAQKGDVLFTVRAPVGDINIANDKIAIGRGIAALSGINISNRYLFYLIEGNKNKFKESSVGTIYDSINKDELGNVELDIHDIPTQQHIVDTIGSVDDAIEKNEEIIKNLEECANNLYSTYLTAHKNSIFTLGECTNIITGKLNANASSENGQYKFFTCSHDDMKIDTYSFDCEAIILSGNGEIEVKYYKGKFDAYQRTYVLCPSKYFFLFMMELKRQIDTLKSSSQGSVIKFITKGMIENITINLNNQSNIFNNAIANAYHYIHYLRNKNNKLKTLKQLLLIKYFD